MFAYFRKLSHVREQYSVLSVTFNTTDPGYQRCQMLKWHSQVSQQGALFLKRKPFISLVRTGLTCFCLMSITKAFFHLKRNVWVRVKKHTFLFAWKRYRYTWHTHISLFNWFKAAAYPPFQFNISSIMIFDGYWLLPPLQRKSVTIASKIWGQNQ